MVVSTLKRHCTVRDAAEFEQRKQALLARLVPHLQRQPGFVSHDLRRDGDAGEMVEITAWRTHDDCRAYLRNGAAALAATWLDAALPTAPYPHGAWLRETVEQPQP
ncbi:MAG TPA: antibiotic biosynthesis monooxygenase [Dehalococcoidia bacterium]|nr:antibiotic biosynthesis monooxygenase [Dehalococcoidia bacterium]